MTISIKNARGYDSIMNDKMPTNCIITEFDRTPCTVGEVGGKGYGLVRLKSAGFKVPPFFIISTKGLEYFLSANGHSLVSLAGLTDAQERLIQFEFPADLRGSILDAYRRTFGTASVAVRSSGTIEDMEGESKAGRFETVLSVKENQLLDAVKKVYASLFADTLNAAENPLMAVVVQSQILPNKAGVAFAEVDKIVLSAVLGQGSTLVSGRENGDLYSLNSDSTQHKARKFPSIKLYIA